MDNSAASYPSLRAASNLYRPRLLGLSLAPPLSELETTTPRFAPDL